MAQREEHKLETIQPETHPVEVHEVDLADKNDLSTASSLGYFA